jgi:hypothetical protein
MIVKEDGLFQFECSGKELYSNWNIIGLTDAPDGNFTRQVYRFTRTLVVILWR